MSSVNVVETTAFAKEGGLHILPGELAPIPDHAEKINNWQDFRKTLERYKFKNFQEVKTDDVLVDCESNEIKTIINKILARMKTTKGKEDQRKMIESFLKGYPSLLVVDKIEFLPQVKGLQDMIDTYNFEAAYGADKGVLAKWQAQFLMDYLSGPVITDRISDHADRRGWRILMEELHPGFNECAVFNRLKGNRLSGIDGSLQITMGKRTFFSPHDLVWFKDNIVDEEKKIVHLMRGQVVRPDGEVEKTTPYDQLPLPEKLKVVSKMDHLVINALSFICSPARIRASSEILQKAA